MLNNFKLIFVSVVLIVLSGTISGCKEDVKPPKKEIVIPSWINSLPPSDTQTTMYGIGIGKSREFAISSALVDMVSRLSISIKSSTHMNSKVVNNSYSNSLFTSDIKANISQIKINNYKVIKTFRIKYNEFAVLLQTDKIKFADGLEKELSTKKRNIQIEYDATNEMDSLQRYNTKKRLAIEANSLVPTTLVLSALNRDSSDAFMLKKKDEFLKEKNSLKFYVSNDKKSSEFIDKIKNYLSQKGFNVVNSKKNSVQIKMTVSDNISSQEIPIAVIKLKISVYDKNKYIGGETKIIKERFNGSLQSVYRNAAIHLEKDIQVQGLNEVIGINLDTN